MIVTIETTSRIVMLDGVPARVWVGQTEAGVEVHCYVTRISPQTEDPAALSLFHAELAQCAAPRPEAIPLRFIL